MDKHFEDLLIQYVQSTPEQRQRIEATLWQEFGTVKAVFVMDLSGFSLLTQKYGIVHYLSMVKRMQLTTLPIVEKHGGEVIKFEADNCFAMFPDVLPAVQASVELNQTFDHLNQHTEPPFDIKVSIGIDYGPVLLIGGPDYFGDTVNCASKIGEDVARPGEIYLTERAFARLPAQLGFRGEKLGISISGIHLNVVNLNYG
ncbi:MAG: adenylate/guanylate cyclase domain-containing protein [Anaerolineae bacterium]